MSNEKDYEEFKLRLNAFQEAAQHYYSIGTTEAERAALIDLLGDSILALTSGAGGGLKKDCPPGYIRCPDGTCIPKGTNMRCK